MIVELLCLVRKYLLKERDHLECLNIFSTREDSTVKEMFAGRCF